MLGRAMSREVLRLSLRPRTAPGPELRTITGGAHDPAAMLAGALARLPERRGGGGGGAHNQGQ